ncbi:MAG TPA: DMT family transporter [Dissulfurispiraceae bacterium]|nr:DMT family transporter [Dissulfurispiraceae bacterium]
MFPDTAPVHPPEKRLNLLFTVLMVLSMVIWGGSWVSAKVVAGRLSPEQLSFWRFFLSFLSFMPLLFRLRIPVTMSKASFGYCAMGAFFMGAYMLFFFKGLQSGYAGAGGVLVTSMIPLMTLLLSFVLLNRRAKRQDIIGLALGITGAAVLLKVWAIDSTLLLQSGNLFFLICPALWGMVTISSQWAGENISSYLFSFVAYGLASLLYLPSVALQGIGFVFQQDAVFWLNLFFLSVISGSFATTVYFMAAERLGSYRTSSFVFIVPASAMLLSWLFLGEVPEFTTVFGGTIAVGAVCLINRSGT